MARTNKRFFTPEEVEAIVEEALDDVCKVIKTTNFEWTAKRIVKRYEKHRQPVFKRRLSQK